MTKPLSNAPPWRAAGTAALLFVLLTAGWAADPPTPAGSRLTVQVEATYQDAEGVTQRVAAAPAVLVVQEVRGARLTPAEAPERRVPPGGRAEYGFTVVNTGNAAARIGLTATAPFPASLIHDQDCDGRAGDAEPRLVGDAAARSLPLAAGAAGCAVVLVDVPAATTVAPEGLALRVALAAAPLSTAPEAPGEDPATRVGGGALTVVAGGAMEVALTADPSGILPPGGRLRLDADARAGGSGPLCAAATEVLRADGSSARGVLASLTVPAGLTPTLPATGAASVGAIVSVQFGAVTRAGATAPRWVAADVPLDAGATPSAIGVLVVGEGCFFSAGATLRVTATLAEAAPGQGAAGAPLVSVAEILHRDPAGRALVARSNEVRPALAPVRAIALALPPDGIGNFAPNAFAAFRRVDDRRVASVRGNTTLRFVEQLVNGGNVPASVDVAAFATRGTFDPASGAAIRRDGTRVANLLGGVGQAGDAYEVVADGRAVIGGSEVALAAGDHLVWHVSLARWVRESAWRCTPLRADLLTPGEARVADVAPFTGRAIGVACAVPIDAQAGRAIEIAVTPADVPAGEVAPAKQTTTWRIEQVEPGFAVAIDVREGADRAVPDGGEAIYLIAVTNALPDGSVDRYQLTATSAPAAFTPASLTFHRADCAGGLAQTRGPIEALTPAVPPGSSACMLLVVRLATGARSAEQFRADVGAPRTLAIAATSLTVASVSAATTLAVDVAHRGGLEVAPPRSGTTTTPGTVAVEHTVRNLGNTAGVVVVNAGVLEPPGAGTLAVSLPGGTPAPSLTLALGSAGAVGLGGEPLDTATVVLHLLTAAGLPNGATLRAPLAATIDYTAVAPQGAPATAALADTFAVIDGALVLDLLGCASAAGANDCRGDAATARPGDDLHYTLTARNAGGAPLVGVVIAQPLPTFTSHVRASGSTDFGGDVVFGIDGVEFGPVPDGVPTGGTLFAAVRLGDGDAIPPGGTVTIRWVVRVR